MQLKIVVVDFELTRLQLALGYACIVGAVALVTARASADVPHTFTPGETLKATDLVANFGYLDDRIAAVELGQPIITAWEPYPLEVRAGSTPLSASAAVPGDATGYWRRVGDTLEVASSVIIDCSGATGQLNWSLPDGITIDPDKGAAGYTGSGLFYDPGTFTVAPLMTVVHVAENEITVDKGPGAGGVYCSQVPDGTNIRLKFEVPIVEWGVTN